MMCSIDSIILHPVQYEYSLVVNLGFLESIEKYQLERGRREGDKEMGSLKIIIELLLKKKLNLIYCIFNISGTGNIVIFTLFIYFIA